MYGSVGLYNYVVPSQQNFQWKWKDYSFRPTPPPADLHGLGAWGVSPAAAAIGMITARRSLRGYGALAPDPSQPPPDPMLVPPPPIEPALAGTVLAVATVLLGIYAVASFYAGKAMAPSPGVKSLWGWYGVAGGLLGGPIGLGIVGAASLTVRNEL